MNGKQLITLLYLVMALSGCGQELDSIDSKAAKISHEELDAFIGKVKGNLVFVEGGEFLMGDYGAEYGPEKLPYDLDKDSKPVHKVRLSGFFASRFKVTNQEYQFYLQYNGMQLREVERSNQEYWKAINSSPNTPAHMDWYEAEKYCTWLATITDLPFYLPTEAQWEYAARSRGQFLMVATDDGTYKATNVSFTENDGPRGINISNSMDRMIFAKQMGWKTESLSPLPADRFPPNPLGLYAMSDNGLEWVKDWYDPNYYKNSPMIDPQGPGSPVFKDYFGRYVKVVRGQGFANPRWGGGVNLQRTAAEPHGYIEKDESIFLNSKTARCVVNTAEPLK